MDNKNPGGIKFNPKSLANFIPAKPVFGFGKSGVFLLGAVAMLGIGSTCLFNVEPGHRAIIYNKLWGTSEKVLGEGTHIRMPWIEEAIHYDVTIRPRIIPSLTGSKDLQMVKLSLRVLSKPNEYMLPTIYRILGTDYDDRVLPSIVNEVSKSVVAQFTASQLITQRESVSKTIKSRLKERAADFNLIIDDVAITHLNFGQEYTNAVEAKQVAQQDAERARFIVDKAQQEKRSAIIKAEGEARSARLIGEMINKNPHFLSLRRIDAAREIANIVARSNNRLFLPVDTLILNTLGEPIVDLPKHVEK